MARSRSSVARSASARCVGLSARSSAWTASASANFAGAFMRKIGPLLPEHRIGRANLRAAFPEKSAAEIEQILPACGTISAGSRSSSPISTNFASPASAPHAPDVIAYAPEIVERFQQIMRQRQADARLSPPISPTGNCPPSSAKRLGVNTAVLYRRPNIGAVSDVIVKLRAPLMGELVPTGLAAPVQLARLLQSGVHVGMLVDQHYTKGVEVIFFGRRCMANPLIALLAAADRIPDPRHARRAPARRQQLLGRDHRTDRSRRATPKAASTSPAPCRRSRRWSKAGCASIRSNGSGCTAAGGE